MNLHETAMGQRFFNVQLPALINTLKDIAAALSRPAPSAISFPADPRFLTSLYYGEYEADVFKLDKRLTPFNQAVQQKEKALLPLLSNEAYFDEAVPYIDAAVKQTKRLKQISDAAFQRQDIDEIESLALALRKEIEAALQPFYMGHMCLYVTPECFDDPPKTPEVYNDATACVWRDGTWQLLEDTSNGFLLFVQSKSKEEAAA